MQFNSYDFILLFLPATVMCYFFMARIKSSLRKMVLVFSSLLFYSIGRLEMLVHLGISISFNYLAVFLVKKYSKKNSLFMAILIAINVIALLYFKYTDFLITNINNVFNKDIPLLEIVLPLGISFYTFQQIAYIVAYMNNELPNDSFIDYLTYILFFPKLGMGPVVDPVDFISQLNQKERINPDLMNITTGIKVFSFGLIKKVLLADAFSKAATWVYANLESATSMDCILLILFYSFEIYFDFSGYSDMATGVASMFNFDLPMNFDSPYKAISIRDFWKRWHMSLTKFFTKYVYIPLGGSRKGPVFTYINTMIVFLVSGLWHGANWTFILWGGLYGLLSVFDRIFKKYEEKMFLPVRWLCTFLTVNLLWLLFSSQSIEQWKEILLKILYMQNTNISDGLIRTFNLVENQFILNVLGLNSLSSKARGFSMMMFIFAACIICFLPENNYRNKNKLDIWSLLLAVISFVWGVLCLGAESTFVYFGF